MFKKQHLALAIAATLAAANAQAFNAESFTVTGYVKNETAALAKDGTFVSNKVTSSGASSQAGQASTVNSERGDIIKSESSVRLFVNGEVGEGSALHADLLLHNDSKVKGSHFKNNDPYTQSEFLRELYVDTTLGDWDLRIGKQQVVWGTADGAKLLDIINPTDYREMAQNTMAESRIPVWMATAEKYLENGANVQVILSQPRENVFAGLNRDISTSQRSNSTTAYGTYYYLETAAGSGHDEGNPFVLLGVDSITGHTNGFLNIVPDLGSVAGSFSTVFGTNLPGNTTTVGMFASMDSSYMSGFPAPINAAPFSSMNGTQILAGFAGNYDTNLAAVSDGWNTVQDSAFEYMQSATFGTFATMEHAKSQYVFDMPDNDANLSFRFSNSTPSGATYSMNYSYAYDPNPIIDLSWRNSSGALLTKTVSSGEVFLTNGTEYYGAARTSAQLPSGMTSYTQASDSAPILRFTQRLERAHNIGGSTSFTIDTESFGPVVLRGEAVYQKGAKQPVVDLSDLAIGDLADGLKMEEVDRFKYVLGADVTVMTDMMLSVQFIQDRNLDHINESNTCTYTSVSAGSVSYSCNRFTADYATMHMTNGFSPAEKNKDFYSIFLSKPFGESGEGRWNNILMLEEGGGRWNRFDVEYSLTNNLIGTAEYNKYWGDANTQFGQLEAASNVQLGLKYLFE